MKTMVELSHAFLRPCLHKQAVCLDGTFGRGKDTRFFLDHHVRKVIAFEIQEELIPSTLSERVDLHLISHDRLDAFVEGEVDAIVFNFGYCPGGNPQITTTLDSSLIAIQKGLTVLKIKGRMALVLYPHEEGRKEAEGIERWIHTLDPRCFSVQKIQNLNTSASPYTLLIEKHKNKN